VLEDCVHHLVKHCGLLPGQLGVITPYAAQVSLLTRKLQASGFNINGSGGSSWDSLDGEHCSAVSGIAGSLQLAAQKQHYMMPAAMIHPWHLMEVLCATDTAEAPP
jgi:hypothetical protein